jgi:hypothetical protein
MAPALQVLLMEQPPRWSSADMLPFNNADHNDMCVFLTVMPNAPYTAGAGQRSAADRQASALEQH